MAAAISVLFKTAVQSHNCWNLFLSQCVFLSNEARNVPQLEENHIQPCQTGQSMQNGLFCLPSDPGYWTCLHQPCYFSCRVQPSGVFSKWLVMVVPFITCTCGSFSLEVLAKTRYPLSSQILTPISYSHLGSNTAKTLHKEGLH